MSTQDLIRWGGLALILTAILFALGGVLLVVLPGQGLSSPPVALLYYLGTILSVPAFTGLYAAQRQVTGALGFAGFLLTILGAILYSGPQLALLAGTYGAAGWHDVWGFAMSRVPILLIGPPAFMIGMILLGVGVMRAGQLPRWAGILLALGSFLWLIAYILSVVPGLLTVASLVAGVGMAWLGWMLWTESADIVAA